MNLAKLLGLIFNDLGSLQIATSIDHIGQSGLLCFFVADLGHLKQSVGVGNAMLIGAADKKCGEKESRRSCHKQPCQRPGFLVEQIGQECQSPGICTCADTLGNEYGACPLPRCNVSSY